MQQSEKAKLFQAVRQGDLSKIQALVAPKQKMTTRRGGGKKGESVLNSVGYYESTVLHLAAEDGHESVIRWILSDKEGGGRALGFTNMFARNQREQTALHIAARRGYLECCKAIVEGCNEEERAEMLNALTDHGGTVFHVAAVNNREEVVRWLLSAEGGRALGFAKVLAKDRFGETALHVAAKKGCLGCCKAIVEGCKVENGEREQMLNVTNHEGTMLHVTAFRGCQNIVRWLLSNEEGGGRALGFKSENIAALNEKSQSALHGAVLCTSVASIQALLSGCTRGERIKLFLDVDKAHGWTALHYATRFRKAGSIRELLRWEEAKVMVDARDHRGMTALHRMACYGGLDDQSRIEWSACMLDRIPTEDIVRALLGLGATTTTGATAAAAFVDVNAGLEIPEEIKEAAAREEAKKRAASQEEKNEAKRSRS